MTREKAIHNLKYLFFNAKALLNTEEALSMAVEALEQQPKMGRWIEHFDESGKWYECDQCHTDWGGPVNYCPNCGAKM